MDRTCFYGSHTALLTAGHVHYLVDEQLCHGRKIQEVCLQRMKCILLDVLSGLYLLHTHAP